MKYLGKKLTSFLLSLVMIVTSLGLGSSPVSAAGGDGTSQPLSNLLTMSDYQKWLSGYTGDDWDFLQTQLTGIVDGAANAGVSPDYLLFGGDFSCLSSASSSNTGQSQVMSILQNKWSNLTLENSVLIQGNHDPADTDNLATTGPYYFADFIIYVINEDDFPTKQGSASLLPGIQKTASDLKTWLEGRIAVKETRPILIASHTSLHYDIDRTDGNNQYAYVMYDAINEAAKQLDVVFLFGHNHTNGDEQVGGSLTFYPKGSKLNICTETSISKKSGTPSTINFTYMNYGYVGYIGDIYNNSSEFTPTNVLTVSQLSFYNDRIEVNRYSKDGLVAGYSNTITRDHASEDDQVYTCEVYYEARGGDVPVESETICQGSYIINRTKPTRSGYRFTGYLGDDGNTYQPGDEISVYDNFTLKAQWVKLSSASGSQTYVQTDTINPGKRYIMVWNSAISDNSGTKYALTDNSGNVQMTAIDDSWISDDGSSITVPAGTDTSSQWDIIWNQGENEARGYLLQNVGTKNYLCNSDTTLSLGNDPAASSASFKSYAWVYQDYNGYNQLAMYNDNTRFLRYSVGSATLKLGTQSTSTDVNNSNVYLYELVESENYRWELADSLESNEEYMIVNTDQTGSAKALTVSARVIGQTDVEIKEDGATKYIDYTGAYNDVAVFHPYALADQTFWLDTWNAPSDSEVIRLGSSSIGATSNHADSSYYFRFTYDNGALQAKEGYSGTTTRTVVYNNGFTVGTGSNVYLFKRVYQDSVVEVGTDTSAAKALLADKIEEGKTTAAVITNDDLNAAISAAQEVYDNAEAQEEEIYDALSTLRKAILKATEDEAGLVRPTAPPVTETPTPTPVPEVLASFDFNDEPENSTFQGGNAIAVAQGDGVELADSYGEGNGKALKLNGTSDSWLKVTDQDGKFILKGLEELTISYDSNTSASGSDGAGWAFYTAPTEGSQTYKSEKYLGIMDLGGTVSVERYNSTSQDRPSKTTGSSIDQWKHVDVVFTTDETILYINGVRQDAQSSEVNIKTLLGNNGVFYIGKANWTSTGEYFSGLIDNFKIYSVAKTEDEIADALKTVTIKYEAGEGGKITGTAEQVSVKGSNTTSVTAVANKNYKFVAWDDGLETATRSDVATEDKTYTAIFAEDLTSDLASINSLLADAKTKADSGDYTAESSEALKVVIEEVEKEVETADTREALNTLKSKLQDAIDKLEVAAVEPTVEPTETPAVTPAKVTSLKATATTKAVKLTWKKAANADSYQVYRLNTTTKKYEKIGTTKTNSYTDKKVTSGTAYSYKVFAYNGKTAGKASVVSKVITKPAATKITSLKKKSKNAELKFKKVANATAYQIYKYDTKTKKYQVAYKVESGKVYKYVAKTKKYKKIGTAKLAKGVYTVTLKSAANGRYTIQTETSKSGYTTAVGASSNAKTLK